MPVSKWNHKLSPILHGHLLSQARSQHRLRAFHRRGVQRRRQPYHEFGRPVKDPGVYVARVLRRADLV